MVSGIMGALDIAPTLHSVEPGLKINGEEWIKVMGEYIAPNCTALTELGRKFLMIVEDVPSHVCRLACEQYKTMVHGTVEFQPPCSPDLSPADFLERAQDTACSASSSCQSRRTAGTFDPPVSQNVDRRPLDV